MILPIKISHGSDSITETYARKISNFVSCLRLQCSW